MATVPGYTNMVTCPYNKSHNILKERFQTHIVKCAKSYPNIKLKTCPFNTTHLMSEAELDEHVTSCQDRVNFDMYRFPIAPAVVSQKNRPQPVFVPLPEGENWDDEDVQPYDPQAYAERASVIRQLNVAPRAERRAFREAERLRLSKMQQ